MARRPYNPFEDLQDFPDLNRLLIHILKSIKVDRVVAVLPDNLDIKLIDDPAAILPVRDILVGDATFSYIRYKAEDVMNNVNDRIRKIVQDSALSFADKLETLTPLRKILWKDYQYFNSMNPIRYMSAYNWRIRYNFEKEGKTNTEERNYPNSKLALQNEHWNVVENTFLIRRQLIEEILYLIDIEIQNIQDELSNTKYQWKSKDPYEVYELLYALIASKRIFYEKGDENTFAANFLGLFGMSSKNLSVGRNKVLNRKTRSQFLPVLEDTLESYGKPTQKNKK